MDGCSLPHIHWDGTVAVPHTEQQEQYQLISVAVFFLSNCLLFSSFSVLKFREVLLCQDGSRLGLMLEIFLVLHNPCYALDLPHFPPSVKREAYQSLCCRVNPRGRQGRSVSCFINGKAGLRSSSNYRWWQVFSKAAAWSWDCAPSDIIEMNRNYRLRG